jgi:WD40 repeat protein
MGRFIFGMSGMFDIQKDLTYNLFFCRTEKELAGMDDAHEGTIWDMSWHPLGHMLVSGSNDHTTFVFY